MEVRIYGARWKLEIRLFRHLTSLPEQKPNCGLFPVQRTGKPGAQQARSLMPCGGQRRRTLLPYRWAAVSA